MHLFQTGDLVQSRLRISAIFDYKYFKWLTGVFKTCFQRSVCRIQIRQNRFTNLHVAPATHLRRWMGQRGLFLLGKTRTPRVNVNR